MPTRVPCVLVVDDDPMVRTVMRRHLTGSGYKVTVADSGAEGLKLLLQCDTAIDLVLLDLMMPGLDGWGFRHAQLQDPRISAVPTVIVTGAPLHDIVDQELCAADYLLKPIGRDHLLSVVRSYCEPGDSRTAVPLPVTTSRSTARTASVA